MHVNKDCEKKKRWLECSYLDAERWWLPLTSLQVDTTGKLDSVGWELGTWTVAQRLLSAVRLFFWTDIWFVVVRRLGGIVIGMRYRDIRRWFLVEMLSAKRVVERKIFHWEEKTSFRLSLLLFKSLEKKNTSKSYIITNKIVSTRKLTSTTNMKPIQCPVSWCRRR